MKSGKGIKGCISYLLSVGLAVIFALFLSGRVGWFLVLTFVCAPVFSILSAFAARRFLIVEREIAGGMVGKQEQITMKVTLRNRGFLPTPPVLIQIKDTPYVRCRENQFVVSLLPRSAQEFTVEFATKICGSSEVGIQCIRVMDYFQICSFAFRAGDEAEYDAVIAVIPDISEITSRQDLISQVMAASAHASDGEETAERSAYGFGGLPGYDSREYMPGDPPKRIHWKQSAKRNKLLVRLDDELEGSFITIVLDRTFLQDRLDESEIPSEFTRKRPREEWMPRVAEAAVEDALGITRTFVLNEYSVVFFVYGRTGWDRYVIVEEQGLAELQADLSFYRFSEKDTKERIPFEEIREERGMVSILCTPYYDMELAALLDNRHYNSDAKQMVLYEAVRERRAV